MSGAVSLKYYHDDAIMNGSPIFPAVVVVNVVAVDDAMVPELAIANCKCCPDEFEAVIF